MSTKEEQKQHLIDMMNTPLGQEVGQIVQVEDDLTDDEWLIKEKYKETLDFGEWLLASEIRYVDNTMKGNIYIVFGYADYYGVRLTIKDLHEIYLKQK